MLAHKATESVIMRLCEWRGLNVCCIIFVAMACVVGGTFYWMCHLLGMESFVCQIVGGVTVFVTRILAVKYRICLPILSGNEEEQEG